MKGSSFSGLSLLYSRTDEESMCRVKSHDDYGEFDRLVTRWEQPIRRLCVRMTGDVHRGEDLKQETFVRLFEKRKDYQPTGKFSTFLWRIALNLCYDELRRKDRRREVLSSGDEGEIRDMETDAPGPDTRAATSEEGGSSGNPRRHGEFADGRSAGTIEPHPGTSAEADTIFPTQT
jgi:RNA polymerase sigma factor (sigma-70 family)